MKIISFLLFLICFQPSYAQANKEILNRKVSITFNETPVAEALKQLSKTGGFFFSYSDAVIKDKPKVTGTFNEEEIDKILLHILGEEILRTARGNYVILTKNKSRAGRIKVSGTVAEKESGKPVENASIYDRKSKISTTSNETGYFEIDVPATGEETAQIEVAKENFNDTAMPLPLSAAIVEFEMTPLTTPEIKEDTGRAPLSTTISAWFTDLGAALNNENIKDSIHSDFQFSLLPYIGTNRKMSGKVSNDYSFNLIGGYSEGNRKFELGGGFNINRNKMTGVQIAGGANIVGDSAIGYQLSGGANVAGNHFSGVQITGGVNVVDGNVDGVQISGGVNVATDSLRGAQISGLNLSSSYMAGLQLAGGLNYAKEVKGVQISGFLNVAENVKGVQLAPFNFADTLKGVPIGFFSHVKSGIHHIELSTDETFPVNIAYRTGVVAFHNIFIAGIPTELTNHRWYYGYGIGTGGKLSKRWSIESDFIGMHVNRGLFYNEVSEMGRVSFGFEYRPWKKFAIAVAATANAYVTDTDNPEYGEHYSDVAPYVHYKYQFDKGYLLQCWAGGKIALRFL